MILLLFARPVSDEDLFEAAEEIAFPRKLISTFTSSLTIYEMSTVENVAKPKERIIKNHGIFLHLQKLPSSSSFRFLPICVFAMYVCAFCDMKTINNGHRLLLVTHIGRNKNRMFTLPQICFNCSKGNGFPCSSFFSAMF